MAVFVAAGASAAWGAAPWDKILSPHRVEADPNKSYTLSEDNGPWMIMACSFSGEGAEKQAHDLVLEFRKKYKLPAYVYQISVHFGETEGRGVDRYGNPVKMKYQKYPHGAEIHELAVLVGDFPSVDDPAAQETLHTVKYLKPDSLAIGEGRKTNASLAGWRLMLQSLTTDSEKKQQGPMGHCFITTNPLVPKEYFAPKGIDSFVVHLNEGIRYSLLKCPGKYTVQVAHFKGQVDIELVQSMRAKKDAVSQLATAAEKAHRLATALRHENYEAYEFHDRGASIVTVGSFNSVGTSRPDGRIELDPKIHRIMTVFAAVPANIPGQPEAMAPKILDGISCDIQPIPVEVPQHSIAADYHHDVLGR
jgi:hypothetical protein